MRKKQIYPADGRGWTRIMRYTAFMRLLGLLVMLSMLSFAQGRKTLDVYVIDVEGGNATLFVAPSGESVLVDSGNGGDGGAPAGASWGAGGGASSRG